MSVERVRLLLDKSINALDYPGGGKEPKGAGAATVEVVLGWLREAVEENNDTGACLARSFDNLDKISNMVKELRKF